MQNPNRPSSASGDEQLMVGQPLVPAPADDPWPVDVTGHDAPHCKCNHPISPEPKRPCTRSRPKDKTCCTCAETNPDTETGSENATARRDKRRRVHKPKTPPKVKLANRCCDWPIADAIAPLMVLLFERASKGLAPKNAFEKHMYEFVRSMAPNHQAAFKIALDAYHAIPGSRRCNLETRFDDWPDDRPLDPEFLGKVIAKELLALGRYGVFGKQNGQASVGEMRLWDQAVGPKIDENNYALLTGPWPWICAVNPGADDIQWYRNRDVIAPDKSDIATVAFQGHEFALVCTATTDPSNPKFVNVDCVDDVNIIPGTAAATCSGGVKYNYSDPASKSPRCLSVPRCVAGQGIALRGFNFLSLQSTVVVRRVGGGFPDMTLLCDVMGDEAPPTKNASCAVRDHALFTLPRSIRDGLNDRDVPTGRYTVELHVPNDANYAPSPGPVPSEFVSNVALIDVIPPIDITYQVWVERGNCYEETSGPGDDEPWFRYYTAAYGAVGKQALATADRNIFRQEDIESGDWIGFAPVSPFDGRLHRHGCVAIAIHGLEVDSEEAAEDQVTDFWDAYALYFDQLLTKLAGSGAGGVFGKGLGTLLDTGVATVSLAIGGYALAAIAAGGFLFAAWAPADPIGYDLLVFDQVTLYNLSRPGGAERLPDAGTLGDIKWSSHPKGFTIKSANVAEYREERQYWSDDEESRYGLDFMITRLP